MRHIRFVPVLALLLVGIFALSAASASAVGTHKHGKGHHQTKHKKHHKKHKKQTKNKTKKTKPAGTNVPASHGQLLHLVPHLSGNTNTSDNWFGYNQGSLDTGDTLFNSIGGEWTVPTATQHTSGQAEASSDWIGIGGGCVDSGCDATDSTLIQTGTEQDVSSTGAATYDAWYELVPAPEFEITSMTIHPGDLMSASIAEVVNDTNVWTITITDKTTGQSYTTTVPYSSTHDTAEWIEETPLEIGTDAGFAALPNLTNPAFTDATTNGASANLQTSQEMDLVDSNGNVIGAPSAPSPNNDGFNACTWASTCSAPTSG